MSTVVQLAYKEIALVSSRLKNAGYYKIVVCNIHNQGTDLERSILENMGISLLPGINTLLATIKQSSSRWMCALPRPTVRHNLKNSLKVLPIAG